MLKLMFLLSQLEDVFLTTVFRKIICRFFYSNSSFSGVIDLYSRFDGHKRKKYFTASHDQEYMLLCRNKNLSSNYKIFS